MLFTLTRSEFYECYPYSDRPGRSIPAQRQTRHAQVGLERAANSDNTDAFELLKIQWGTDAIAVEVGERQSQGMPAGSRRLAVTNIRSRPNTENDGEFN